jgi:hypothetical protein
MINGTLVISKLLNDNNKPKDNFNIRKGPWKVRSTCAIKNFGQMINIQVFLFACCFCFSFYWNSYFGKVFPAILKHDLER